MSRGTCYKDLAINVGVISALVLGCIAIGFVIARFSELGWLSASLFVFASVVVLGQWIEGDGRSPGGLEYDPSESSETRRLYNIAAAVRYSLIAIAVVGGVWLEMGR